MAKKAVSPYRGAVVQHPPVTLNRPKTLARGVELLDEAAAGGAKLVSFPETWVPGYPEWVWRLGPGEDYGLSGDIHKRRLENSVDLKASQLKPIQAAARRLVPIRPKEPYRRIKPVNRRHRTRSLPGWLNAAQSPLYVAGAKRDEDGTY